MDQRGGVIGLALIGLGAAALWWWALVVCRTAFPQPGAIPGLALAAAAATYLCVPETDQFKGVALLLLGVGLVEVVSREVLAPAWHALLFAVVLWAGLVGATDRGSAVVGAVFAGWVLVLPAATWRLPGTRSTRRHKGVAGLGTVAALVVARTGALGAHVRPAVIWSLAAAGVSVVMALLWLRLGTRQHPER